ncbi:MAG TPA: hypothetical protein VNG89_06165, partial [Vicinamibacterales bacterium]|nr:hypothetical protein [Vicinamibacterales bacterium]
MNDILQPMLASLVDAPLDSPSLVYEPKYDGIRAIAEIAPKGEIRLWSRLGNEKTDQFPEISNALRVWSKRLKEPIVLDGEVVALDAAGQPAGFQNLQGRIHLKGSKDVAVVDRSRPVALILFDILRDGADDVRGLPLTERRQRLDVRIQPDEAGTIRLSEQAFDDGR